MRTAGVAPSRALVCRARVIVRNGFVLMPRLAVSLSLAFAST
jgi:hypothetical protein